MVILGFDFGHTKIGIANGQTLTHQASPVTTLKMVQQRPDWEGIARLIDEWRPELLIVGLPLNMDDSDTVLTERTQRFGRQLRGRFRLPVEWVDERLSTKEAASIYGKDRKGPGLDALAAKIILDTWLQEHDRRNTSA